MDSRRVITLVYVVLLAGLGLGAGALYLDARAELNQLKQTQADLARRLENAQKRLAEQERIYERLQNDPKFVEKIIRERLHYARPDEDIYRFPDPEPAK